MTQEELNEILKKHKLWLDTKGEEGKKADLSHVDLTGADLRCANLIGANLSGADLSSADLKCADLRGTNLRDANLICADLIGVNLRYADLEGVNLSYAHLAGADLRDVDLSGADLEYVNLIDADLESTGVYFFIGPKHKAVYNSKDDKLFIGCQVHSLEHWLNNYVDIGKKYKFSDEEIDVYGNWFKELNEFKPTQSGWCT